MEPFEIEIHEIRKSSVYVHKIKLTTIYQLHHSCELLNKMLKQCEDYLANCQQSANKVNRKFLFATTIHKEVMLKEPKCIISNSLTEFFETINYDPNDPNIEKTLICL